MTAMPLTHAGFATRAIHAGYDPAQHLGAVTPPVYLSTTFAFPDVQYGGRCFTGEEAGYIYTRISNPTLAILEARLASLEGGEAALAFGSGMGAITSTIWTLVRPGDEILADKTLYGCTFAFLERGIGQFGVRVRYVDMSDLDALAAAFTPQTRVLYFESPANPTMSLVDITAVAELAHRHDARVVIDNTYCTPYLQRPLELGADVVVHSATKYLSGHGDVTAGVAVASQELIEQIRLFGLKDMTGAVLSPQDAALLLRGVKTLALRMERHCDNAEKLADVLAAHPAVDEVYFPGLSSFPQHALATRQMRHVALHRAAVPKAFAAHITLEAHQKAADYTLAKGRFAMLEMALGSMVLLGWTLLGGLDALHRALLDWLGGGMVQQLALLACFGLISGALDVPTSLWQTFRLEQRFGFNQSTLALWLADLAKSTALAALIGLPIVALMLWLMGAAGPLWWLWAWGTWMALNLLLMVLFPLFIAPLFNQFEPLADEALKSRVTALMQRCGFTAKGLYVMDGSRRSKHANAYFTGFGAARRVVFYDTLLAQLTPSEVEAVLAHELGHFKHKHITRRMAGLFAMSLAGFALLGWLSGCDWFYTGLGVQPHFSLHGNAPNDALALLLFLLVVPVFTVFVTPLMAQLSRRHEFEADAYAVSQTSAAALAAALLKLYQDNASTLTPDPLYARFYYSPPPASERLARLSAP